MKKLNLLILALTLFLAACGDSEDVPKKEKSTSATSSPIEEVVKEEESVEESTQTFYSNERYYDEITTVSFTLADDFESLAILFDDLSNDSYLVYDENWSYDVVYLLYSIQEQIDAAREIEAPPAMEETHRYYLLAMDEYQKFVDTLPDAIDTMDLHLLELAIRHLDNGNEFVYRADEELKGIYFD